MNNVDRDDRYAVQLCSACGGSGRTVSLTTIRRRAGEKTAQTFKHLSNCKACHGEGTVTNDDEQYQAAVRYAKSKRALDAAAQVRVLERLRARHADLLAPGAGR